MNKKRRVRALDSRGRPVRGLYVQDGRFMAGFKLNGTWHMQMLQARTLTEARRERESLLAGLRESRIAAPATTTFADVFEEYLATRVLADRTRKHERWLLDHYLDSIKRRRIQDITASEIARLLRGLRERYSPWTCVAVYRVLNGTFSLALRRGILTRSPIDGLAPAEKPKQQNAKRIAVLGSEEMDTLVTAGSSERIRVALGLAGYAGLRLGELRGLRWGDIDFSANMISVRRSATPAGTFKEPKTDAGRRTVPLLPVLRRLIVAWRVRSPQTSDDDLVLCTVERGKPMEEKSLRRVLDSAKGKAGLGETEERLSWHSLRHSFASMLATDLELPATTLARVTGHSDPGFTLKVYARDGREDQALVEDVLARATAAKVGG